MDAIFSFSWLTLAALCITCGALGSITTVFVHVVVTGRRQRQADRERITALCVEARLDQDAALARLASRGGRIGTSNVVQLHTMRHGGAA